MKASSLTCAALLSSPPGDDGPERVSGVLQPVLVRRAVLHPCFRTSAAFVRSKVSSREPANQEKVLTQLQTDPVELRSKVRELCTPDLSPNATLLLPNHSSRSARHAPPVTPWNATTLHTQNVCAVPCSVTGSLQHRLARPVRSGSHAGGSEVSHFDFAHEFFPHWATGVFTPFLCTQFPSIGPS